jgi:tetratricopeptide (TPR) repeat protein
MFQGELTSDSPREYGQFAVDLQPVTGGGGNTIDRAFVGPDGRFQFRNVTPGSYLIVVKDRSGQVVSQQYGNTNDMGSFSVRLPEERKEKPISGLVSLAELSHNPPKAAMKAYREASKKGEQGDWTKSIELLEKAVQLDPDFLQAINNLGSHYMRVGRYDAAAQCFRRAIVLAPKTPMLHGNLAQSLLYLRDYQAAEAAAREAIALNASDPLTPRAQLALGLALAGRGEYTNARAIMVTCAHSPDDAVRKAAESFLSRLR